MNKPVIWDGRQQVQCQGKDPLTPAQARDIEQRMRRRNRNTRVNSYHCPACGHWHVGSSPPMLKAYARRNR